MSGKKSLRLTVHTFTEFLNIVIISQFDMNILDTVF